MSKSRFFSGAGFVLLFGGLILAGAEYPTNSGLLTGGLIGLAMMGFGVWMVRKFNF